jgi:hypothetical protein
MSELQTRHGPLPSSTEGVMQYLFNSQSPDESHLVSAWEERLENYDDLACRTMPLSECNENQLAELIGTVIVNYP